jgi:hypothetical protein
MKKSEFQQKARDIDAKLELEVYEKERRRQLEVEYENRLSNRNRARSVTVGTAFGGTTELGMRMDGGKNVWCIMQPVEVIELIYQLAANVGCGANLMPRKDFASWRDWRVSDAEKKHLNGHAPQVNDMAVFQQLGASGYNDDEAKRIMDIIANAKEFANEDREDKVYWRDAPNHPGPNLMMREEDGLLVNKLLIEDEEIVYVAGGNGGTNEGIENGEDTVATEKTVNKRTTKRTARAA